MKLTKKLLALVLCLVMTVAAIPMTASALSDYEDGELLIKMSSLDPSAVLVNRVGATVNITPNIKAKRDTKDTTKILANSTETYGGIGLATNLPLTGDTAYTIEYYAKLTDPSKGMGMFFGFCHNNQYPYYGADFYAHANGTQIETHSKWWNNGWYVKDSTTDRYGRTLGSNIWTTKADADGFVQFVMTFDGRYMNLKIAGTDIGKTYDMTKPHTNFKAVADWELKTLCLEAGFTAVGTSGATAPTVNNCIVQIKDISIYSGVVNPDDIPDPEFVTFKGTDGKIIKSTEIENNSLTLQTFPEVNAKNQLVWINEGTGAIAQAPMTFTDDTTLRAYDIGKNESKTLGVQYGEVSGGKQDIRFIGGIYDISGAGVGMEITAKYKGADGSVKTDTYRKSGNTVYDKINATEGGTLKNVTAKELGAYYLYGVVIEDVPTDIGQIDFTVKSFKEVGKNKLRIYGETVTVSFVNGAVDAHATPLS